MFIVFKVLLQVLKRTHQVPKEVTAVEQTLKLLHLAMHSALHRGHHLRMEWWKVALSRSVFNFSSLLRFLLSMRQFCHKFFVPSINTKKKTLLIK